MVACLSSKEINVTIYTESSYEASPMREIDTSFVAQDVTFCHTDQWRHRINPINAYLLWQCIFSFRTSAWILDDLPTIPAIRYHWWEINSHYANSHVTFLSNVNDLPARERRQNMLPAKLYTKRFLATYFQDYPCINSSVIPSWMGDNGFIGRGSWG